MFKWLGSIGKGFATAVGSVTAVTAFIVNLVGHSGTITDAIHTVISSGSATIAAIGGLLAIFGIGRKAGATLSTPDGPSTVDYVPTAKPPIGDKSLPAAMFPKSSGGAGS